jgi:hypothetical protein
VNIATARAELLHVPECSPTSNLPTGSESSGAIQRAKPFAELLIDLREDKVARAVVFALLRGMERRQRHYPWGRFGLLPPQASLPLRDREWSISATTSSIPESYAH